MTKRIHVAIGVRSHALLKQSIDYYTKLFDAAPDEEGQVFLGTGREVTGAYWTTDEIYLYVFLGREFGKSNDVDHLGIQFTDEEEMDAARQRVGSERWSFSPSGVVWELFPEVGEEE